MCGRKKPSFLNLLLPFLLLPMVEDESVLMSTQSLRERIYCSHVSACSHANEGRHCIASLSRDIGNSLANAISKVTHIQWLHQSISSSDIQHEEQKPYLLELYLPRIRQSSISPLFVLSTDWNRFREIHESMPVILFTWKNFESDFCFHLQE